MLFSGVVLALLAGGGVLAMKRPELMCLLVGFEPEGITKCRNWTRLVGPRAGEKLSLEHHAKNKRRECQISRKEQLFRCC